MPDTPRTETSIFDFHGLDGLKDGIFDFDDMAEVPLPDLDGEWTCQCDLDGLGNLVDVAMSIKGDGGQYVIRDRINQLSDITAHQDGTATFVTFRWSNKNGTSGSGRWALNNAHDAIDGVWSKNGDTKQPRKWIGTKNPAMQESSNGTSRLPLPSLDGEWQCICDLHKVGTCVEGLLQINGSRGSCKFENVEWKLSNIECFWSGGVMAVEFEWKCRRSDSLDEEGSAKCTLTSSANHIKGFWEQTGASESRGYVINASRKKPLTSHRKQQPTTTALLEDVGAQAQNRYLSQICEISAASFLPEDVIHGEIAAGDHLTLITNSNKTIVIGYALFRYMQDEEALWIEQVAIEKTRRNSGLGTVLVEWAIDHAKQRKLAAISLKSTQVAQGFYTALGFLRVEKSDEQKATSLLPKERGSALMILKLRERTPPVTRFSPPKRLSLETVTLDGNWECEVDLYQNGKVVDVHMKIHGQVGEYSFGGQKNKLSSISYQVEGDALVVSFRWSNSLRDWTGTGTWRITNSKDIIAGSWSRDGYPGGPYAWRGKRVQPNKSAKSGKSGPSRIPRLDGDWDCQVDFGTGALSQVAMKVRGSNGEYCIGGKEAWHKLSQITGQIEGGSPVFYFRWSNTTNGWAGAGRWALSDNNNVINGGWTRDDARNRGPWKWNGRKKSQE